jgi:hypothetical protein
MLSRTPLIHEMAGEKSLRAALARRPEPAIDPLLIGSVRASVILLALLSVALAGVLFLNRGAVVEPKVRLLVLDFERPGLLPVLFLTSALTAACTLAAVALIRARKRRDEARGQSRARAVQLEAADAMHAATPRAVSAS